MVLLNCAVVGEGSVISIIIEDWKTVALLKKAIKDEKPNTIKCDADGLKLFLTKMEDGAWLKSRDPLVHQMGEGGVSDELKSLYMKEELDDPADEIRTILPSEIPGGSIHVQMEMERLKKNQLLIDFAPIENGEAFWSEETQMLADAITDEAVFNAFVTPYFNAILEKGDLVFVNSERYRWLPQSTLVTKNAYFKPDGFVTHRGMYRGKPEPKDRVQRPSGFRFGVAEEDLFDCLILFESKIKIDNSGIGQVVRYLENLCPKESASAILFDCRSFWLIRSERAVFTEIQRARWTTKGSKSLFENFIHGNISHLAARLSLACLHWHVNVAEGDAFLGRGAYGRVFKVTGRGGEDFALKIVEKCSVGRLYREEKALATAQRTGLTISPVRKLFETPEGAALLLSPVGKPLPQPMKRQQVLDLFELLWQLHAKGLVHGDPRVSNVILVGEKPLWIDLVEALEVSPHLREIDVEILTRSILNIPRTDFLHPVLKELIGNYATSTKRKDFNRLSNEVCLGFSN